MSDSKAGVTFVFLPPFYSFRHSTPHCHAFRLCWSGCYGLKSCMWKLLRFLPELPGFKTCGNATQELYIQGCPVYGIKTPI